MLKKLSISSILIFLVACSSRDDVEKNEVSTTSLLVGLLITAALLWPLLSNVKKRYPHRFKAFAIATVPAIIFFPFPLGAIFLWLGYFIMQYFEKRGNQSSGSENNNPIS